MPPAIQKQPQQPTGRVGAQFTESNRRHPWCWTASARPLLRERQQQHVDENSHASVHRSSYSTVRDTVVLRTRLPLVPVTVMV